MKEFESKIDVKQALRVYEKIVTRGEKLDDGHRLSGISALSDFDGYTVVLRNENASLTIQFHSKFTLDYTNQRELFLFLEKLESIDRSG